MTAGVADTHTALWYLYDDARLSVVAGDFVDQAAAAGRQIVISSISQVEIVDAMRQVPRAGAPDMPDRIVAAAGVYFGMPVISRDGRIRAANLKTVLVKRPANPGLAGPQQLFVA